MRRWAGLNQQTEIIGTAERISEQVYESIGNSLLDARGAHKERVNYLLYHGAELLQVENPFQARFLPGPLGAAGHFLNSIAGVHEHVLDSL